MIFQDKLQFMLNNLRKKCTNCRSNNFLQDLFILIIINELCNKPEICCVFVNKQYDKLINDPNYLENYHISQQDFQFLLDVALFNHDEFVRKLENLLNMYITPERQEVLNKVLYPLNITLDYLKAVHLRLKALNPVQLNKKQNFLKEYSTITCTINIRFMILEIKFNGLPEKIHTLLEVFLKQQLFKDINNRIPEPCTEHNKVELQSPRNYYGRLWSSKIKSTGRRIWIGIMMQNNNLDLSALVAITDNMLDWLNNYLYSSNTDMFNPYKPSIKYLSCDLSYYPVFKRRGLFLKQSKEICTQFVNFTNAVNLRKHHLLVAEEVDTKFKFIEVNKNTINFSQLDVINTNDNMIKKLPDNVIHKSTYSP